MKVLIVEGEVRLAETVRRGLAPCWLLPSPCETTAG